MEGGGGDVTELIRRLRAGEASAQPQLFELLYAELRRIASARMRFEDAAHTLTPTALVNEAYLRLGSGSGGQYNDRAHFLAVAAQAMRRVLVDHARARLASKRDAPAKVHIDAGFDVAAPATDGLLLTLDEALEVLREMSPRQCRVVELRYFGGLTEEEAAEVLGVARRTVNRDWAMARAWLHERLEDAGAV